MSTAAPVLTFDSPELCEALKECLTSRQYDVFFYRYIAEKRNSTIAAILRVSLSTIEKELAVIRSERDRLCKGAILENVRVNVAIMRSRKLMLGTDGTLVQVMTGRRGRINCRT